MIYETSDIRSPTEGHLVAICREAAVREDKITANVYFHEGMTITEDVEVGTHV